MNRFNPFFIPYSRYKLFRYRTASLDTAIKKSIGKECHKVEIGPIRAGCMSLYRVFSVRLFTRHGRVEVKVYEDGNYHVYRFWGHSKLVALNLALKKHEVFHWK